MLSAKPFASLSGGLLARKGGARPAMRPQGYASLAPSQQQLEDLGWNDMGQEPAPPAPAPLGPTPEPTPDPVVEAEKPPVLVAREALAQVIEAPAEAPRVVRDISVATATRLSRETAHKGRAAFTLRLDAPRHLKLRIASALAHQSAQQLVAHALDQFLATVPEVDALVAQLPPQKLTRAKGKRT